MINADFDVRQLVLAGTAFGPREIEQLRGSISRDSKKFDELKEAVDELKGKTDDALSPAAVSYTQLTMPTLLRG